MDLPSVLITLAVVVALPFAAANCSSKDKSSTNETATTSEPSSSTTAPTVRATFPTFAATTQATFSPRTVPYTAPPATQASGGGAYYANCTAARAAGAAPLHRGDPGYRPALDRDGDGVACE